MLSRRLIRIKILQILYAYYTAESPSINKSEKELHHSLKRAYDLYYYLLILIVDIANYAENRIELGKVKRRPIHEDLHPNTRFINNPVIQQIFKNREISIYLAENKLSWINYPEMIKSLYATLQSEAYFQEYMATPDVTYVHEKDAIIKFYMQTLPAFESLYPNLEEQSIYWNDDAEFVLNMIVKTIEKFKEERPGGASVMPMFKNQDDQDFVKELFRKSILNQKEYEELIKLHTQNWDYERIAFMDILIMQLAVTEALHFPSIPTRVTLNEYIEISKFYSTEKSSVFINGILDKIFQTLKQDNKLNKQGRGLIGDI